jgi:hypothetical protein
MYLFVTGMMGVIFVSSIDVDCKRRSLLSCGLRPRHTDNASGSAAQSEVIHLLARTNGGAQWTGR